MRFTIYVISSLLALAPLAASARSNMHARLSDTTPIHLSIVKSSAAPSSAAPSSAAPSSAAPSSSASAAASKSVSGAASSASAVFSVPSILAGAMVYSGCFTDSQKRALGKLAYTQGNNTVALCKSTCAGMGYMIAGMEAGVQCFCGKTLENGAQKTSSSECTNACPGGDNKCGGSFRLSVYSVGEPKTQPAKAVDRTGQCKSVGCQTDAVSKRVLADHMPLKNTTVSVESCADACKGYKYFGVEYGGECYCGNKLDDSSKKANETECNMPCLGAQSELCGGSNRLNVYECEGH